MQSLSPSQVFRDYDTLGLPDLLRLSLDSATTGTSPTASEPHQCHHCESVAIRFELDENLGLYDQKIPYHEGRVSLTLANALEATHASCHLYIWILRMIERVARDTTTSIFKGPQAYGIDLSVTLRSHYKSTLVPNNVTGSSEKNRAEWSLKKLFGYAFEGAKLVHRYQRAKSPFVARVHVHLLEKDDNSTVIEAEEDLHLWKWSALDHSESAAPIQGSISAPAPPEWNKGSDTSFIFARKHFHQCKTSHAACGSPSSGSYTEVVSFPSRLLYIAKLKGSAVRLIETKTEMPESGYATLSYCWGGPQSLYLSQSNYSNMRRGIQPQQLARTIRDAIQVCSELGISYLWVDALCIVQDDGSDKQRELGRMSFYYRNSLVTICAACAPSVHTGFLASRGEPPYEVPPMMLTFDEIDGNPVYEQHVLKHQFRNDANTLKRFLQRSTQLSGGKTQYRAYRFQNRPIRTSPISERAWTFQEALLSPRMLVYTSDQVYWCCGETYIGCGGLNGTERVAQVREHCGTAKCACGTFLVREIHDLLPDIFTLEQRRAMSTSAQWSMVVENFSARGLTVKSDKLDACAAIASYFQAMFEARWDGVRYAAGMWYSAKHPRSFCRQLLWTSSNSSSATRPRDYRAPSWSWTSIDGRVRELSHVAEMAYQPPSLVIRDMMIQPASTMTPFGELQEASLAVCGKLRTIDILCSDELLPKLSFDTAEDVETAEAGRICYLLEVTPFSSFGDTPKPLTLDAPRGLILTPVSDDPSTHNIMRFKRIGSFTCPDMPIVGRKLFEGVAEADMLLL